MLRPAGCGTEASLSMRRSCNVTHTAAVGPTSRTGDARHKEKKVKPKCLNSCPYSPIVGEGVFSEVRVYGVLRSSLHARNAQATAKIVTLGDTLAAIGDYAAFVTWPADAA